MEFLDYNKNVPVGIKDIPGKKVVVRKKKLGTKAMLTKPGRHNTRETKVLCETTVVY